jgi:uncharacterized protein YkwD
LRGLAAAVAAVAAALLVGSAAGARTPLLAPPSVCPDPALSAPLQVQIEAMRCFHNYARHALAREALEEEVQLDRSAALKGRWIETCRQFSHTACGRPLTSAFSQFLSGDWQVGENLAAWPGSLGRVREIFAAWLRSAPHRQNLLRPDWTQIGIARVAGVPLFGGTSVTLWVVHFGTRSP